MRLRDRVLRVFRGQAKQGGFPPAELMPYEIEYLADSLYKEADAPRWGDPSAIAWRLGERLVPMPLSGCGAEICIEGVIAYRDHPDERKKGERIFHALSHRQIRRYGKGSESDVWMLQGELVAPWRRACDMTIEELMLAQPKAPEWLLLAQAEYARGYQWVEAI